MHHSENIQPEMFNLEEMTPYEMVHKMHEKFGINYVGPPRHLDREEKAFRIVCLREEVSEYEDAKTKQDELDALIDLTVFALGTLDRHGYPFLRPFIKVMRANMKKELAQKTSNSKRSFEIDLVKPEGWQAPDMKEFVEEAA